MTVTQARTLSTFEAAQCYVYPHISQIQVDARHDADSGLTDRLMCPITLIIIIRDRRLGGNDDVKVCLPYPRSLCKTSTTVTLEESQPNLPTFPTSRIARLPRHTQRYSDQATVCQIVHTNTQPDRQRWSTSVAYQ